MTPESIRKQRELEHGRRISQVAEGIWSRDTPAGQRRMEYRFEDLQRFLTLGPESRLLELGAGTGVWTQRLTRLPVQITSIDLSPPLLDVAKSKLKRSSVQFQIADAEHLPFAAAGFDAVCGLSVLHHLDLDLVLKEIYRVLKPGGKIWFSEPNMMNPQILIQKNVPWIKKWLGDTPDESAFFRWPLKRRLQRQGFQSVQIVPFDFLHPKTPASWTAWMDELGKRLQKIAGLREIGGSLLIRAQKGPS